MTDHLSLIGVQRWQLRSTPQASDNEGIERRQGIEIALSEEIISKKVTVKEEGSNKPSSKSVLASESAIFTAYAATSIRVDTAGNNTRWLWVVPQTTLPTNELQLLDKIVLATKSNWEHSSVADNYMTEQQLNGELSKPLSAIIVLGDIESDDWEQLFSHETYKSQRFFMGISLQEMIQYSDKKRIVWQSLQGLM